MTRRQPLAKRYEEMKQLEAHLTDDGLKHVGQSRPNRESASKVTGEAAFIDDLPFPNLLHAALLLSPHANARILAVDTSEAEALPGVRAVVHYFNSPHAPYNSALRFHGDTNPADMPETEYIFDEYVRFVGDRVAAVAAEDADTAEEAVRHIKVTYEVLPAVFDELVALNPSAPQANAFGIDGTNVCGGRVAYGNGSEEEVLAAIDAADYVFEDTFRASKVHHGYLEPVCHVATYTRDGKLTVYTPSQNVFCFRSVIAKVLGLPYSRVRVVKGLVGGAFGGKLEVMHEPVVALLSMRTYRPVKLRLSRKQVFLSTRSRHPGVLTVRSGVRADGKLVAQHVNSVLNTGGYAGSGVNAVGAQSGKTFILYDAAAMFYNGVAVYTNTPPAGAMRGYGCPQIMLAREVHIDRICQELGMDPVEWRLKNVLQPHRKTCMGADIHNARIADCIRKGAEAFDWTGRRDRAEATRGSQRPHGVGVGLAVHGNGWYGVYQDLTTITIRLQDDGSAVLLTGTHDLGTGSRTILAQIAAEVLTVDPDLIEVIEADTDVTPIDLGAQASRTTYIAGNATIAAARNLRQQVIMEASRVLGRPPAELDLRDGYVVQYADGQQLLSVGDVVTAAQRGVQGGVQRDLIATESFESLDAIDSYAADFCEVEVDTETGHVNVLDFLAVHNSGRVINPMLFEGQVHGGIHMGLGYALSEEMVISPVTGEVKNPNFKKYHMFTAREMPENISVLTVEDPEEAGPFGAKSIGECATDAVAPAVVNAVNHALRTEFRALPLTPARILQALRERQTAG
jgi:CO/xanthine dehydrogenase Mo-binding subunit